MSELLDEVAEAEAPQRDDVVEGEPGWEGKDAEATPASDAE